MRYIGSKKTLKPWIFEEINKIKKVENSVFCDLFAGSCEITKEAKKQGAFVVSNDLQYYSYILAKYYLEDNNPITKFDYTPTEGIITDLYANKSMYFTKENAMICDGILKAIKEQSLSVSVLAGLIMGMDEIANQTGYYDVYLKHFKDRSLKKVELVEEIIPGKKGEAHNRKAEELITEIGGDILYLDPPYNTRQYSSKYHVLETIAKMDNPKVHGKTVMRDDCEKSVFLSKKTVYENLEHIIKNANFGYIFLSYNDEGLLSLEQIKEIFEKYGEYSVVEKEYKRFKSGKEISTKTTTIEYLHILKKEQ